ncbi:MAG: oxidoreductase [Candidatus Marinimicrobia bacterium]|nr:oxidoreductase [Candidatus Neomarinimicrobiota bacterium]|tara:strand:- start:16079 stop:17068 length:990 start_codon:yes stop_codon:yes gene_type:complete
MGKTFQALTTYQDEQDFYKIEIREKSINELPDGDLIVRVQYSSLNYKDALSATGTKGITQKYPHTPGIDAAGIVADSSDKNFPEGTRVIVSGYDLGVNTSGGFGQYIKVPNNWVVKCPDNLSTKEAMMIGTAGLTAAFSADAILNHIPLNEAEVIVSGATGGIGSIAVNLLSLLGAKVSALTGKSDVDNYLFDLGATQIIQRDKYINETNQPLSKGVFHAAVDVAGGATLSSILACIRYQGVVTCCGNVGGAEFETSVYPFILRGNSLIGIDTAEKPLHYKEKIWNRFSREWKLTGLDAICNEVNLNSLVDEIKKILEGQMLGRVIVKM